MNLQLIGYASLVIASLSYLFYITDILRRKTKPHAFTWLVWAIAGFSVCVIQLADGAGPGAWVNGYAALMCGVIFLLALKYGERNIVLTDWIFLTSALIAYLLWLLTNNAVVSVILFAAIDILSFLPTFRKSFHKPSEETANMYWLTTIEYGLSLIAIQHFTFTTALYPIVVVVTYGLFAIVLYVRRYQLKQKSATIAPHE